MTHQDMKDKAIEMIKVETEVKQRYKLESENIHKRCNNILIHIIYIAKSRPKDKDQCFDRLNSDTS
jgi:hypothetical protein